eukprot:15365650-Ditylum_brightwellii.AAC.1
MATTSVIDNLLEASQVGFGDQIPISAENSEGLADIAIIVEEIMQEKRKKLGLVMTDDDYNTKQKKGERRQGRKAIAT